MSNDTIIYGPQTIKSQKGKFSWCVPLFEVIMVLGYFALGWNAVTEFISSFDLGVLFENIINAIYFLIVCTVITTIMCFIPIFKSRYNTYIGIWNIIWLGFNLYGFLSN